ncbi:MAG TPA: hypothetical protein VLH39_02175, partial [Magnetospirillaceae bacterium]|nr:hypothetical protein [Magnetospirillaceae bacterium]
MSSLYLRDLLARLALSAKVREFLDRVQAGRFPVDCGGLEGSLPALLAALCRERTGVQLFVVVPTDLEAEGFARDLGLAGVEAESFPWWGTAAYRPLSPRSPVFGERSAALARALGRADGVPGSPAMVVVASQRAALTPVPPPEYFRGLLKDIARGQSFDPGTVAGRLASFGYLRVPRVSLPGEFAMRGEVLDVFMPGDVEAYRVVFAFDKVEGIRRFDPADQGSRPEKMDRLTLRPVKEIV